MKKEKFNGYIVAAGCLIIMFMLLGSWSSFGLIIPKIAEEFGCSTSSISIVVSASTISAFVSSFLLAPLLKKLGAKKVLYIATVVSALGAVGYGLAPNPTVLFICGFIPGITLAWGTNACCATVISQWFIEKRGSVVGVVFGGAALGATFFTYLTGVLLEKTSYHNVYFIFAGIVFAVCMLVNIFMIKTPQQLGQKPLGWEKEHELAAASASGGKEEAPGLDFTAAKRSLSFWLILIGSVFVGTLFTGFNTYAPTFWQTNGMDAATSSLYMTVFSFIGVIATVTAGVVADKFGSKIFISYLLGIAIIGLLINLTWAASPAVWLAILGVVCMGLAYPAQTSVAATVTTESFGSRAYGQIVSWLSAGLYLGKASVTFIMGIILDSSSINSSFVALTVFVAIALVLMLAGMLLSPWQKQLKSVQSKS